MQVPVSYYDEIYSFSGDWDVPSKCGLKIGTHNGQTYVIVTELYQDNPGTSVTYAGRKLAEQICANKGLQLADILYIECNPDTHSKLSFYDEEYFLVDFNTADSALRYRQLSIDELKLLIE
ncbi:MAG: hypothetical protein LBN06_00105 [Prevotellaceae bacterium]|jgi:hypothetical protein|nr:hypothetical protein [Prevotellaceae bacterium]